MPGTETVLKDLPDVVFLFSNRRFSAEKDALARSSAWVRQEVSVA
jgi:hypothetical protein